MRNSTIITGLTTALALAWLLAACNKSPTTPSIVPPVPPVVARLEIAGPNDVPPGGTAQFTVTAHLSNGSSRSVTSEAQWQSSNPSVLSIGTGGLAAGHERGEATISAQFSAARSTREVIVVPASTYRLAGRVSEAEATDAPLANARVEVTGGSAAGLSTTTAADGRYSLYGVAGQTEIRVTKDGYQPHVRSFTVAAHQTENFELTLLHPRENLSGLYTLTIVAAADCRDALPEEARLRTYTADLKQDGPRVETKLSGATFTLLKDGRGNHFSGRIEPNGVAFSLTQYSWYYKGYGEPYGDLVEQITPSMYLVVDGLAVASISPTQLSGTLNGSLQVFSEDPRWGPRPRAKCRAEGHRFTLSR